MGIFDSLFGKKKPRRPEGHQPNLVVEEYDLATAAVLGALRDDEQKSFPDVAVAADRSQVEWRTAESSAKTCKQIIIAEKDV